MHYFACVPVHHMHAVPTEVGRASPCDWSYSLKEPWWCWESSPGSLGEHCVCVCVCGGGYVHHNSCAGDYGGQRRVPHLTPDPLQKRRVHLNDKLCL